MSTERKFVEAAFHAKIDEECKRAMDEVGATVEHNKCVTELNGLFNALLDTYHDTRRETYLYIGRTIETYFGKGFLAGMDCAIDLFVDKESEGGE